MRSTVRFVALCLVASLALLAISASAAAARKPITGKLSKPGYTVIALATSGRAKVVDASGGSFRLRPPARRVTLHLRAPGGKYAGPIVISRKQRGRLAILGVRAGARLGRVTIRKGHAQVARRLSRKWVDARRTARARRGVPLGARAFGRVRSRPPRRSLAGDRDLDGVHDLLDIDDDGDLILDNLDHSRQARAAQPQEEEFGFELDVSGTLNANSGNVTPEQINEHLKNSLGFNFDRPRSGEVELDCGPGTRARPGPGRDFDGLPYCRPGGTGTSWAFADQAPPLLFRGKFPEDFDYDGDGFGTLRGPVPPDRLPAGQIFKPGADSSQIGTGDVFIAHVTEGGNEREIPKTLTYLPLTFPALVSYSDGRGNSGTISYPRPDPLAGSGPGTRQSPFPVKARANGRVFLTVTVWPPQRARIANDPALGEGDSPLWTDIGGLFYGAGAGPPGVECWPDDFSENEKNLAIDSGPGGPGGEEFGAVRDDNASQPANPRNTLTFTVDVTQCLGRKGNGEPPPGWPRGQTRGVGIGSTDRSGARAGGPEFFFTRVE